MSKVLGIDCSTQKLSWVIVEGDSIIDYGELYFEGTNFIKRYQNVRETVMDNLHLFKDADYLCFEKAVMVRNADVALKLAGVFAVALSCLSTLDIQAVEVQPLVWQNAIGNPIIRGEDRNKLLKSHPEIKTKSGQQKFIREVRKQKTLKYVEKRSGKLFDNDDLGDAAGLAFFFHDKIDRLYESKDLSI